jgi:hypothetical protein
LNNDLKWGYEIDLDRLKITFKKSPVKFGRRKTLLFQVECSWKQGKILFITDRSRYAEIKKNPSVVTRIVNTIEGLSETLEEGLRRSANITVTQKRMLWNKTYHI